VALAPWGSSSSSRLLPARRGLRGIRQQKKLPEHRRDPQTLSFKNDMVRFTF
jgi:hypothetical protein